MLPQIAGLALLGAAGAVVWRMVKRESDRVTKMAQKAEAELKAKSQPVKLEQDPETGIYRPTESER